MKFTPTATRKTFVVGCLVLVGFTFVGVWNIFSLLESVSRLLLTEAANERPLVDREQRQRVIQALQDQAWWIIVVFVVRASVLVGLLLAANWVVRREFAQRQLSDKRLQDREARLSTILDYDSRCVNLVAEDGSVLEMNAAGLQMIEAGTASQVIGHQVAELLAPEYRHEFQLLNERVFRGESATLEFELIGLKGGRRWMETHAVPLRDEHGRVVAQIGLTRDITERKRVSAELQSSHERLAGLSRQLLAAQESERRQVARELHDEIGQMLTAISLNLSHLKAVYGPEAHSEVDASLALVGQTMSQVRDLSLSLRPPILDLLGLDAAVRSCVQQHRQQTGCDVQLQIHLESRLSPELEITCYRVVQSALTNIARHAQASQISVEIGEDDQGLALAVRDNGIGVDLDRVQEHSGQREHFGILAMRERIQSLGGSFCIDSVAAPGTGTVILAQLPLVVAVAGRRDS